ncbi:MAG: orotidine-5'-phosphate decarboxylase [Muribaculaceae bacterium]
MDKKSLVSQIKAKRSFLCVGLDPDCSKMPELLKGNLLEFNKRIIDATAQYAVAFKPNLAFYECLGVEGYKAFEDTVKYIKEKYPEIFIIADAKRGDIGNTSKMYAKSFFETLDIDAVTVAPYMGEDSVTPFLTYKGKWVVLLCLTSNKGSHDFQLTTDHEGTRLFEKVLIRSKQWGNEDNMMYVVGATQGQLFEDIRKIAPDSFLLVPGVGAQGGSLEEVSKYGMNADCGLLVNSSRGIIHASNADDFDAVAATKAKELQLQMEKLLIEHNIL